MIQTEILLGFQPNKSRKKCKILQNLFSNSYFSAKNVAIKKLIFPEIFDYFEKCWAKSKVSSDINNFYYPDNGYIRVLGI